MRRTTMAVAVLVVLGCGARSAPPAPPAPPVVVPAPVTCPSPPAIDRPTPRADRPNGTACTAGCPSYHACQCDETGRVTFREHTYGSHPDDRRWFEYDANGSVRAMRIDRDADGRLDASSVFASVPGCTVESRDEDLDGVSEATCRYDGTCAVGGWNCQPVACETPVVTSIGRWCKPAECPPSAKCACDERDRIVEIFQNLDADAAFEQRTTRRYLGDEPIVTEQHVHGAHGSEQRTFFEYDAQHRLVRRTVDAGAPPIVQEDRFTYAETSSEWTHYEHRDHGTLVEQRDRTLRDGKVLTTTYGDTTLRFFPGAPSNVVQPVVIRSSTLAPADVSCKVDRDCVLVPATNCCDCASGGAGTVVNRAARAAFVAKVAKSCGPTVGCATVISSDPSCSPANVPTCVDQVCTLRGPAT